MLYLFIQSKSWRGWSKEEEIILRKAFKDNYDKRIVPLYPEIVNKINQYPILEPRGKRNIKDKVRNDILRLQRTDDGPPPVKVMKRGEDGECGYSYNPLPSQGFFNRNANQTMMMAPSFGSKKSAYGYIGMSNPPVADRQQSSVSEDEDENSENNGLSRDQDQSTNRVEVYQNDHPRIFDPVMSGREERGNDRRTPLAFINPAVAEEFPPVFKIEEPEC